jgi:hypothetical protein
MSKAVSRGRAVKPKLQWFARGGGIAKCGPFASQVEATDAMRMVTESDRDYARFASQHGPVRPQFTGGFPSDVFVWPELT